MKLELETKEVDFLMNVLAQRPWGEVNDLIGKLVKQANDRLLQQGTQPQSDMFPELPPAPQSEPQTSASQSRVPSLQTARK